MNASAAETAQAMTLAHMGIEMPFTATSQPNAMRTKCTSATNEKMTTTTIEMGFNSYLRLWGPSWSSSRPRLPVTFAAVLPTRIGQAVIARVNQNVTQLPWICQSDPFSFAFSG